MAWSAPQAVTALFVMTAAWWNRDVRDNMLEQDVAKVTTAGDLVYASGVNALTRLANGGSLGNYALLSVNAAGNAPEWGLHPFRQAPLFNSANGVNSSTSITDIVTQAITTTSGYVLIVGWAAITEAKTAGAAAIHTFRLYRDSTQLTEEIAQPYSLAGAAANVCLFWLDTPGAGTFTYKVRGMYQNANTSGTPTAGGGILLGEIT